MLEDRSREQITKKKLDIPLSRSLIDILSILQTRNFTSLLVGGAVRDAMLGEKPKDIDIEVYGIDYPELQRLLLDYLAEQRSCCQVNSCKGHADFAGQQFAVVKFCDLDGNQCDFSIPRRENKLSGGLHRDFEIVPDPDMSPKEAALRRDFTWNSMAYDPLRELVYDFFGGVEDLNNRIIRHTSDKFAEDPLRVLRGMQFAARFGCEGAPETVLLAREMADRFSSGSLVNSDQGSEHPHIARERICEEFFKFAEKAKYPSKGLEFLRATDWIRFFPELKAMCTDLDEQYLRTLTPELRQLYNGEGVPQDPQWHPEGNVWKHTLFVCDGAACIADRENLKGDKRAVLVLAALLHDVGKAGIDSDGLPVTRLREKRGALHWTSHAHEPVGAVMAERFLISIGIKSSIIKPVIALVGNHLVTGAIGADPSDRSIHKLAIRLNKHKTDIETLMLLIEADRSGCLPVNPDIDICSRLIGLEPAQQALLDQARALGISKGPAPAFIEGKDIQKICPNLKPGPIFGQIINRFYKLQISGEITTHQEALARLQSYCEQRNKNERVARQK